MGVYDRNKGYPGRKPNLWVRYTIDEATRAQFGLSTREQREPADTSDKRIAAAYLSRRRRELRDGTWRPHAIASSGRLLVRSYSERWIAKRKKDGVKTVDKDEQRLRDYILPAIGDKPLDSVRRADMLALVERLQNEPGKKGKPLSPRSIHHVYWLAHNLFADALRAELILRNPCSLEVGPGELPKKRDRDPRWRSQAVFTREEIELLISDERVPLPRRVFYALTFFSYMRVGEAAGRPWRDYDAQCEPLGKLLVPTQYEDQGVKTEIPREVPVHPALASILASWRLEHWPLLFGRAPRPDDLIVPKLRGTGPRDKRRVWMDLQRDLKTLGLRCRRFHDLRRTAISLSLAGGADKYLLKWVTHGPEKEDAFDLYATPPWQTLCEQVAKLKVAPRGAHSVAHFPRRERLSSKK